MIFARRALQRRLDELRVTLGDPAIDPLVDRLNRPGKDRIAAMWEAVVLHSLGRHIESERALPSGRRPDVWYDDGSLRFIADITAVSDDGVDAQNPFSELQEMLELAQERLGLPPGGLDLKVDSRRERSKKGTQTYLRLPPRNKLRALVDDQIVPQLRAQKAAGQRILRVVIDDNCTGLKLTIDTNGSQVSRGSHSVYDAPTIKTKNPLYNALRTKAEQLQGANDLTGIIVGDADCVALSVSNDGAGKLSSTAITREFLRQHSSVDFVVLITVEELRQPFWPPAFERSYVLHCKIVCRDNVTVTEQLEAVFRRAVEKLPKPVAMPVNGASHAKMAGYGLGHHGGYRMSNARIRISSRELVEVLAGQRTLADGGAIITKVSGSVEPASQNDLQAAFLRQIQQGRLPTSITVVKTDEDDNDDWIDFNFGDPDPAVSPFK